MGAFYFLAYFDIFKIEIIFDLNGGEKNGLWE
jgi:hypothetical protein